MKEIREYIYKWMEAIASGKKYYGHDFFSGFPNVEKQKIKSKLLTLLGDSVHFISLYYVVNEFTTLTKEFKWLKEASTDTVSNFGKNRELIWNLNNVLRIIEEDLKKKDNLTNLEPK